MADELIKLGQWSEIAKLNDGSGIVMPFVQEIFLLECKVAGTGYYIEEDVGKLISPEDTVILVREADNKYDEMAIRIDTKGGVKIGYVPRRKNEILARLLDGGKILYGKVVELRTPTRHDNWWIDITIKIYMKDL